MGGIMLTTIDNPFDPFTQWDYWKRYDEDKKYYTCSYLARIAMTADDLSDEANDKEIERAINEILQLNILGIYRKVYENSKSEHPGEGA